MNREDFVLAAMVPGAGFRYSPVQIQKLLFLLDRQIPHFVGGPHFNFVAYHYGPFDPAVYLELEQLAASGHVTIDQTSVPRTFALTPDGVTRGEIALHRLEPAVREFIQRTSYFVQTQSFSSLVSAIYKAFPEMRVNSVFQD
jgi:uncharacterized protein